jgi:hypothetical protein
MNQPPDAHLWLRPVRNAAAAALFVAMFSVFTGLPATGTVAAAASQSNRNPCGMTTTARVVAIGDVHGAFDSYVGILRAAGLIDDGNKWAGGQAVMVQLGDVLDRGPDSRKVLDLIRELERDAERAGGQVRFLLGNHEVMRMDGNLTYTNPEEYRTFQSPTGGGLREAFYDLVVKTRQEEAQRAGQEFDERAFRDRFYEETPLGLVELLQAFRAAGDYGRWLTEHDIMVKINGVVYVHGGISPEVAQMGCAKIVDETRKELRGGQPPDNNPNLSLLRRTDGPLWYRGLIDGTATDATFGQTLERLEATRMVVGHTSTQDHRIGASFGNRLFAIDTGMLGGDVYEGGVPSALEIQGETVTAIYLDRREVLVGGVPSTGR